MRTDAIRVERRCESCRVGRYVEVYGVARGRFENRRAEKLSRLARCQLCWKRAPTIERGKWVAPCLAFVALSMCIFTPAYTVADAFSAVLYCLAWLSVLFVAGVVAVRRWWVLKRVDASVYLAPLAQPVSAESPVPYRRAAALGDLQN